MVYLSGIRLLHIENGLADLTKNIPLLRYLLTAIRRSSARKPLQRHPITPTLLVTLKTQLHQSDLASRDWAMFWAAFTLAFYGFLRASEYTSPSSRHFNPRYHLSWSSIQIRKESMMQLRRSKTDRFGHSVTLVIGPTGTSTCSVAAMRAFLRKRNHSRNGPLFVLQCGRFLTRRKVSSMLRVLLHSTGVDPTGYSSHSFRIGAATTAAAAGLPDHLSKPWVAGKATLTRPIFAPPRIFSVGQQLGSLAVTNGNCLEHGTWG